MTPAASPTPPPQASLVRRACALLIDATIVAGAVAVLLSIMLGEGFELYERLAAPGWMSGDALVVGAAFLIPYVAYEGVLLQRRGQTVGKMVLGLRVVRADGEPLAAWQAWVRPLVRVLFRWLSIVNNAAALVTRERTCLHDLIARTRVVRLPARAASARDSGVRRSAPPFATTGALWALWTLVTFVGWIAGAIASEVVVGGPRARPRILYGVPAHAILGVLVGVAQWVVLRRRVPGAWPWVPATAAAWAASWLAIDRIEANVDDLRLAGSVGVVWWVQLTAGIALHWIAGWAPDLESLAPAIARRHLVDGLWRTAPSLLIAFSGALLGAAQLPLLRRWTSRAGWWVVANVAAYGAAAWIWTMSIGERRTAAVWLGLAFPVLQWCLLRPRWKTLSPWALLCALAWPLALWRLEDDFAFIILFSTMSGLCLEWLLQEAARSRPDSLRPSALLRQ